MAVTPGMTRDALADLTIGERDARLLQLRTALFGSRAEGFAECPRCAEHVEFPFDTANFTQPKGLIASGQEVEIHGIRVGFRLPTSPRSGRDREGARSSNRSSSAHERCVASRIPLSGNENEQLDHHLPNETVEAISRAILDADPRAEIRLELDCPSCAHRWKLLFDIGEFFWLEISAQAHRLLREIETRSLAPTAGRNARFSVFPTAPANLSGVDRGMSHYLARLVERTLGTVRRVEPIIAPLFAAAPLSEIGEEPLAPARPTSPEVQLATAAKPARPATPEVPVATAATLSPPPLVRQETNSAAIFKLAQEDSIELVPEALPVPPSSRLHQLSVSKNHPLA